MSHYRPDISLGEEGANFIDGKRSPQTGSVRIGQNVYFQSFVSVKRAINAGEFTEIDDNTYVCSFVNIGHNVKIGKNCFLATGSKILGNCVLGDYVYVGSNAVVTQNVKIGNYVKIRAGEVVNKDIPDNTYWSKNGILKPNKFRRDKTA